MSCSRSNLLTGCNKRLDKRHRNSWRNPGSCRGQWSSPDNHASRPGQSSLLAGFYKGWIKRCRVGCQRFGVTFCKKAAQKAIPLGLHQGINRGPKLWCRGHYGKRHMSLTGRTCGSSTNSDHRYLHSGAQSLGPRIPEGRDNQGTGFGYCSTGDILCRRSQRRRIRDHARCVGIRPTHDRWQMLPRDTEHCSRRLLRTVRIDQNNRFHGERYPA